MSQRWWLVLIVLLAWGCGPPTPAVRPVAYDIRVRLDPVAHTLDGQVTLELARAEAAADAPKRMRVDLLLHPELSVDAVEAIGAILVGHRQRAGTRKHDDPDETAIVPAIHGLTLEAPEDTIRLTLKYRGRLHQNVAAGEEEGQIHNFAVSAHVGEEGLYLEPSGYWYPRLDLSDDGDPARTLSDYTLTVEPVDGFEFVAGAQRDGATSTGALRFKSPFPIDGMVLLGGPLSRWSRSHNGIELHAVLPAEKRAVAADILDAAAEYLDLYQPLIGPYPYKEFTVLEAFFSSGFAFPTCTQIAGSQLSEFKQYRRHGYLDHELLHNWWGNGLFVDPRDGNWCEGLASYMGNYYGHILEGDEAGARKQRRNQSNFLSAIEPDEDRPLGSFGLDGGAGRGIGYQKGAAVFHMLERKIGREALFQGLRRLTAEQMGRFVSWQQLQAAFEHAGGTDLTRFFDEWVRGGGAPLLELTEASWTPGSDRLSVTVTQGPTGFALDVPLRLHYGQRAEDVSIALGEPTATVEVPCETAGLTAVELDPDYHVFRRLKPEETMPTTAVTRRARRLLIVTPAGDTEEGYRTVLDSFTRAVLGDEDEPREDHEVVVRPVNDFVAGDVDDAGVLILGSAVRHPEVAQFIARTRSPVAWTEAGFRVDGEDYVKPGQAVLITVHHPDRAEDGVTVYYGNSAAALANARVLNYYANSLLVFDTPPGDAGEAESPAGMPHTTVIRRSDFEFHDRVDF